MNVTFTVKSKDEGSMEDVIIRSHSSVAADWGLLGWDAKTKALQSFQTSRTSHTVTEGHTPEDCNLKHEPPRNKHATEWIFCLPVHLVWCPWNWLVLLSSQTILGLRQLGEWYVLLGASLQDTIHSNRVDQLQRWFCENTLSHLSSPGRVSRCAQPGGNVTGIKIIMNIKIMNTHGLCYTLPFNIISRMDFTCQGNEGHKRKMKPFANSCKPYPSQRLSCFLEGLTNCGGFREFTTFVLQALTILQGGSNMTGTDLCVNKPHCAAAVQCGLFTYKSVPVIFEPPCILFRLLSEQTTSTAIWDETMKQKKKHKHVKDKAYTQKSHRIQTARNITSITALFI